VLRSGKSASKPRRSPLRRGRQRPQHPDDEQRKHAPTPAAGDRRGQQKDVRPLSAAELADRVRRIIGTAQPRTGGGADSWRAGHSPPRTPPTAEHRRTADPPSTVERDANAAVALVENGVEPCKTRTCPSGRPSVSAAPQPATMAVTEAPIGAPSLGLDCPVEETDKRGRKTRTTDARDKRRGIPQGSPLSPLLANIYMRRFVLGWKKLGLEHSLGSLFEPSTEVIRKGKAGKPTEFGKIVKLQEAENQIVVAYEVYGSAAQRLGPAACRDRNASSNAGLHAAPGGGGCRLLLGQERGGRQSQGVKRVCIPNRSTKSPERKREQRSVGSATARNGGPAARVASAWPLTVVSSAAEVRPFRSFVAAQVDRLRLTVAFGCGGREPIQ